MTLTKNLSGYIFIKRREQAFNSKGKAKYGIINCTLKWEL